jgi:glucose/arabinose dehydrogenase
MNRSLFLSLTVSLLGAAALSAATYPTGFTESVLYSGLQSPAGMDFTADGRLFIGEQKGKVYLVRNDTLRTTPILNIQHKVDYNVERGFQAVIVDPDFAVNGYVYVYYTARYPTSHNRVSRFTFANNAIDTTETILFELPTLPSRGGNFTNQNVGPGTTPLAVWHMGGGMVFGNDGKLYIGVGDHEGTGNGQDMNVLFGKMLRINANGTIPADNPYYGTATGDLRAIWASGVRSPFTLALHKSSGRIYINDVGDGAAEEVDTLVRGGNHGWGSCEGYFNRNSTSGTCSLAHDRPIYAYRHGTNATTTGQGVIGGGFATHFRSQDSGRYFFGDFNNTPSASSTSGWIRSINAATGRDSALFATGVSNMTGLKFHPVTGAMYIIARGYNTGVIDTVGSTGKIGYLYKVTYDGSGTAVRAPHAPRARPGLVATGARGTLTVPTGVIGVELFDLKGTRLWMAHDLKRDDVVALPASLPQGVLKYRWIYRD